MLLMFELLPHVCLVLRKKTVESLSYVRMYQTHLGTPVLDDYRLEIMKPVIKSHDLDIVIQDIIRRTHCGEGIKVGYQHS